MRINAKKRVIIIGAGLAGLRLGQRLIQNGYQVDIFEKENHTGGLMETIRSDGFIFDLGPHVFFREYSDELKGLIGDDLKVLQAIYGIGYRKRQILSPIRPLNLLLTVGPIDAIPMISAMVRKKLGAVSGDVKEEDAKTWGIKSFGEPIFNSFFKNYIPKVTGLQAEGVSQDWWTERHRFYKEHNAADRGLMGLIKTYVSKQNKDLTFYYPDGGAQQITDALADDFKRKGGVVHTASSMEEVCIDREKAGCVNISGEDERKKVCGDIYISTIPVTDLLARITPSIDGELKSAASALGFRSLWLFFVIIRRPLLTDKVQIYFPEAGYIFKRIYEPKNLIRKMGDPGKTAICVEVPFGRGDEIDLGTEEEVFKRVLDGIKKFYGLEEKEIENYFSRKVPYSYSIYGLGYQNDLEKIAGFLFKIKNLISFGRQGSYRYNFLHDRVMDAADKVFEFIDSGKEKDEFLGSPGPKTIFF